MSYPVRMTHADDMRHVQDTTHAGVDPRTAHVLRMVERGEPPDAVLAWLVGEGVSAADAPGELERLLRAHVDRHAREAGLPPAARVPAPVAWNGAARVDVGDRCVDVLAHLVFPPVVVFGGLLDAGECEALIELARPRLARSRTLDEGSGQDIVHAARTSEGMHVQRGATALCERIERRIARLLDWPYDHGEGLQVLRYGPGARYEPHHDYFDPAAPGTAAVLARGGQRVASLVMYLNTPEGGGATVFPDAHLQVGAVAGNAVFFSYDRPHPMTRSLHGGAPVLAGEKWIATKWLRERRHD